MTYTKKGMILLTPKQKEAIAKCVEFALYMGGADLNSYEKGYLKEWIK